MRPRAAILIGGLLLCLQTTACETNSTSQGSSRRDNSHAAPSSFLRTSHGQLEDWLSERFDVTYRNMKLGGTERENIFAQQPVNDIHYRFEDVARSSSMFHLRAENISRREILYRIAVDYGLKMTVENINGKPAYMKITGNSPGSRFDPGEVIADEGTVREL